VAEEKPIPGLDSMPAFDEELIVVAPRSHGRIRQARDVRADTLIVFPNGCAYRRRLQAWLATDGIVPDRVLELGSYHAIVACIASGTGIAIVPRSVLQTVPRRAGVVAYRLSPEVSTSTTVLAWRMGECSSPLQALQGELSRRARTGRRRAR